VPLLHSLNSIEEDHEVLVTKFEEIHSCPPHLHQKRPVAAKARWLIKNTKSAITADRNMKPVTLQCSIQLEHGERVNYMAAWRAREIVREERFGDEKSTYSRLPALKSHIINVDPNAVVTLEKDVKGRFKQSFVCHGAFRSAFYSCRPILAVDGTFTKSRYIQTLLLAAILDAEDNVIILAFAIVPSESQDSWNFFFQNLKFAVEVDNIDIVIISDRDKGLEPASTRTIPNATHSHCCFHIAANF
jgi:hypothetical protein